MDSRLIFLHHPWNVITDGGTQKGRHTGDRKCLVAILGGPLRKIREVVTLRRARKCGFGQTNLLTPCCQEKPLGRFTGDRTVNRHR